MVVEDQVTGLGTQRGRGAGQPFEPRAHFVRIQRARVPHAAQQELQMQRGLPGGVAGDKAGYQLVDRHAGPAYHTHVL
ncbi:hypothetical protein MVI01_47060 [Myxococcus virescens]|uniref:Uncharacterized protein n=1 Tax=Myxococcus virescens TaxID=83456 RepID=A0A511HH78_9BACT|nr:hypothetical protein MVI01_47060 [Myxococcus virescens]